MAEDAAELAGGVLLLPSRRPVAGMEPGTEGVSLNLNIRVQNSP